MYSVTISDHILIAHSLPHPGFGRAQGVHGATYTVEATFSSEKLTEMNIVIDIDHASRLLAGILDPLRHANLDDLPAFKGQLTTTEYLAHWIYTSLLNKLDSSFCGRLGITLRESPNAWASFDGPVG